MILTWIMFVVAISLSAVAAFYSIVGLAAIFAAAVWPIVIMGSILEVAKLTVTVWLHEYWRECRWVMKLYLVPAVFVLMVITSMGIFGFLSKAHIDQIIPTGDKGAQIALFDERIANERAIIDNSRSLIKQMDDTVNGIIAKGESREIKLRDGRTIVRSPAELALQVRRSQARDRDALTKTIEEAQARIVALQEERAPIAREIRGLEAEVGPIKYIAALIYGDNPDTNLLERAVRWMIIILVAVFDPLAVMMLLAATESRKWYLESLRKDPVHGTVANDHNDAPADEPTVADEPGPVEQLESQPQPLEDGATASEPAVATPVEPAPAKVTAQPEAVQLWINPSVIATPPVQAQPEADPDHDELADPETSSQERQAKALWKKANPGRTLKEARRRFEAGEIDQLPWMAYMEAAAVDSAMTMGRERPTRAARGDVFVDVSGVPTRVYKYTGERWIELDRTVSDRYVYDEAYITHLVERIAAGEYDPDLLTDSERQQIEARLRQDI